MIYEVCGRLASRGISPDLFTPLKTFSSVNEIDDLSLRFRLMMALKTCPGFGIKKYLRSLYRQTSRPDKKVYDLYWEPNYIPLEGIHAEKTVVTIYDLSVQDHPEWHPSDRVRFHEQNFFPTIGKADLVTTISEFSRQRFLALQSVIPAERVRVIPCAVDQTIFRPLEQGAVEVFRKKHGLPVHFLLFVGTVEPRKNLIHLLNAYEQLPRSIQKRYPLVLAGDSGWKNKDIQRRISRMGARKIGYLKSRSDLALLYNAASAFVFPSLYEGFGIPPLEAMACGTPVCLSAIPVFHEVYGKQDICYGDPQDAEHFSEALRRLLEDAAYRDCLIRRGQQLADSYTWEKTMDGYHSVFQELLS